MVKSGSALLKESISIFMQTTPEGFDHGAFEEAVLSIPSVMGVGDIHTWSHAPGEHHLTCRIAVMVTDFCDCDRIVKAVEHICHTSFNIQHSTIQLVYDLADLEVDHIPLSRSML